jgi:hypothetical protein
MENSIGRGTTNEKSLVGDGLFLGGTLKNFETERYQD